MAMLSSATVSSAPSQSESAAAALSAVASAVMQLPAMTRAAVTSTSSSASAVSSAAAVVVTTSAALPNRCKLQCISTCKGMHRRGVNRGCTRSACAQCCRMVNKELTCPLPTHRHSLAPVQASDDSQSSDDDELPNADRLATGAAPQVAAPPPLSAQPAPAPAAQSAAGAVVDVKHSESPGAVIAALREELATVRAELHRLVQHPRPTAAASSPPAVQPPSAALSTAPAPLPVSSATPPTTAVGAPLPAAPSNDMVAVIRAELARWLTEQQTLQRQPASPAVHTAPQSASVPAAATVPCPTPLPADQKDIKQPVAQSKAVKVPVGPALVQSALERTPSFVAAVQKSETLLRAAGTWAEARGLAGLLDSARGALKAGTDPFAGESVLCLQRLLLQANGHNVPVALFDEFGEAGLAAPELIRRSVKDAADMAKAQKELAMARGWLTQPKAATAGWPQPSAPQWTSPQPPVSHRVTPAGSTSQFSKRRKPRGQRGARAAGSASGAANAVESTTVAAASAPAGAARS
jgi:hypothetical protein